MNLPEIKSISFNFLKNGEKVKTFTFFQNWQAQLFFEGLNNDDDSHITIVFDFVEDRAAWWDKHINDDIGKISFNELT